MSELEQTSDEQRPDDQDWEAAVDGALQQAEAVEQATSETAPPRRSKKQILALLLILLVIATSWSVWTLTRPVPPLEPEAQQASLAGVLYILSQQLEGYRAEHLLYPATLEAVSPPLGGVAYRLEGEGYVLQARANGVELIYRSWEDSGGLVALAGSPVLQEISR